jgi:outer membrane protein assembly factor BamB
MRLPSLALVLGLILPFMEPTGSAAAEPWPRFRGPNGTGIASDRNVPVRWSGGDGLLWKVPIPGLGNSSPVIWGERIFLQSASQDGKERLLLCLNAADGKTLWTRTVPGAPAKTHPKNTVASSTPATDGERVYALFWDGKEVQVHGYDIDGKPLWNTSLGEFTSQHGAGTSPVVHAGKVFIANDQDGSAALIALDARTGKIAWQAQRQAFRACYSAPFVLERPGGAAELIVVSTAGITSYRPDDGAVNWHWTWPFYKAPLRTVASPIYGLGLLFANSGDGGGDRDTVAIEPGPNARLVWQKRKAFPYVPTMLVWGEHVYFVTDDGFANCCNARTGEKLWVERLARGMTASPILIDGKIYAVSEDGVAYVYPAAPTFRLLAKNPLGEPVMATPAVADGRLLIRGREHLFCIARPAERRASRR